MLELLISLLLSLGSTVEPNITIEKAQDQLEAEHNIKLDEDYETLGF